MEENVPEEPIIRPNVSVHLLTQVIIVQFLVTRLHCNYSNVNLFYKIVNFFVAKYLTNRRTDMVLLYSEASYRSRDGFRV